jgi:glyoxylase-like metal-dependent hydrolase (beta-lactamase superfamily II)
MQPTQIVPGVYQIALTGVNAYLIEAADGLTLIDTGMAGHDAKILAAVRSLGRQPQDIKHILVTHCHADHSGSLAALKEATGAPAWMHSADAALVRAGQAGRPLKPAPGLILPIVVRLFMPFFPKTVAAAEIECEVQGGEVLAVAGGLRAIHAPGHSTGQLVFLWPQHGGVLFSADTMGNLFNRADLSIVYEDLEEGCRTLAQLARMEFATACPGHGPAMVGNAAERFQRFR